MLPPTILTEAIAQVGAIMILAKPENREKLLYFRGIERVRYRRPVHPGDVVVIEATVLRLRSRMGVLKGIARVDGKVVVEGTMTFALGPRNGYRQTPQPAESPRLQCTRFVVSAHDQQHPADLERARHPDRPLRRPGSR